MRIISRIASVAGICSIRVMALSFSLNPASDIVTRVLDIPQTVISEVRRAIDLLIRRINVRTNSIQNFYKEPCRLFQTLISL